ncbi:hypothetical protein CFE70_000562 [Pyrenophora teres f. teres 0-1]|nr:hypothetical protein HRS9122_06326 [Pyrenophora teres f. teres]
MPAKTSILSLFDTVSAKFPLDPFTSSLPHLLTTLSTLATTNATAPRSDAHKALGDKATEVMNTLQKRLGTQEYLKIMAEVQKGMRERREERRRKRKVEAVVDPVKWGMEKRRRHDVKRVNRKEKGREERGKRRGW